MRLSENRNEEVFEELPLREIKQKYEHLPGGPKFVADLQSSRSLSLPSGPSSFWSTASTCHCERYEVRLGNDILKPTTRIGRFISFSNA